MHRIAYLALLYLTLATPASADPSSGVDVALFRSSYDSNGLFSLEGARLLPPRDLSFKLLAGYAKSPVDVTVPGIGSENGTDSILNYAMTFDMAFGMSLSDRIAIGFDVGGYRTATGAGYGTRGTYGSGGLVTARSTGLVALRPLSNLDPSASPSDSTAYLGDELAGPLDAHVGLKVRLYSDPKVALALIGSVFLPFGDEQMLLGDANLVYEPKLAGEYRLDRSGGTRLLANVAARIRQRTVLEGYDTQNPMATSADAKAFLDVGSELVAGLGAAVELTPRTQAVVEGQLFQPLPDSMSYGSCHLYSGKPCSDAQYWPGAKHGDRTGTGTLGMMLRI